MFRKELQKVYTVLTLNDLGVIKAGEVLRTEENLSLQRNLSKFRTKPKMKVTMSHSTVIFTQQGFLIRKESAVP